MDLVEMRDTPHSLRHPWEQSRFNFFSELINREIRPQNPISVLDVGSGDAWFSTTVLSRLPDGSNLTCWDFNFTDDDQKKLRDKHSSVRVDFCKLQPNRRYNLILLMDVLEHIEDAKAALKNIINKNLAEDGSVIISVPAWQSLFTSHDHYLKHYRRYSPKQGLDLIWSAGLKPIQSGGLFHSLLYLRLFEKIYENLKGPRRNNGVGVWKKGKFLTNGIVGVLDFDSSVLKFLSKIGISLPGLSWWALCKKQ